MTQRDKDLIERAWSVHFTEWFLIDELIDQAESEEARERLRTIRSFKYHREEFSAGCL